MAVTMADITKLRKMSGAGMMDCKKALTESDGDIEKAMEIIRKKGQAIAAKRSDRYAAEGCVLAKKDGEFAAIIALKCETDFVAKNEDFIALTQAILDAAVANKCKTLDEVKALPMGKGTVQDAVTDRSGITGEKMELDGYNVVEGAFYLFPKCSYYFGKTDGTRTIENADDLAMYLLEVAHVACVGGTSFGAPECIRMSYATSDENIVEAIKRIKEALAALK